MRFFVEGAGAWARARAARVPERNVRRVRVIVLILETAVACRVIG